MLVKKASAWTFRTSSSGGLGIAFFSGEGGTISLKDPSKTLQVFRYGAAGAGWAFGCKLPKVGRINLPKVKGKSVGGVAAPEDLPNIGKVYVLDSFAGDELTREDIRGVCAFVEVAGGLVAGGYGYAMIFGMDPVYLGALIVTASGGPITMPFASAAFQKLRDSATGLLLCGGASVGVQAGGGVGGFLGALF